MTDKLIKIENKRVEDMNSIKQKIIHKINHQLEKRDEIDVSKLADIAYDAVMEVEFNNLPSINNGESE